MPYPQAKPLRGILCNSHHRELFTALLFHSLEDHGAAGIFRSSLIESTPQRSSARMKLIRFGVAGQEKPGIQLKDGARIDATAFGSDYDERFFASGGLEQLHRWMDQHAATAPRLADSIRLGPPI